jgi:hypothetical protein
MAKTVQQIYNELVAEKTTKPELAGLNSTSQTAIFTLWLWVVAYAHKLLYDMWDVTKNEISQIASQQIVGTIPWYVGLAMNWTGGSKAITACWPTELLTTLDKKLIMKVANTAAGVGYSNLSDADLAAFKTYIGSKKVVGTDIDIISQTADLLLLKLSIKYVGVQATVSAAIVTHIKNYLAILPFGSQLSITVMANSIFSVAGVLDVIVDDAQVSVGLGYTPITTNYINADAGYFEIGKNSSNNDLITLNMYL